MGGLLHLVQRGGEGLGGAGLQPTQAPLRCTKCNSSPSTANVLITALLCGFDVPIKGLSVQQAAFIPVVHTCKQELSYRKQIARKLRTQYAGGIYDNPMTLKSRLTVT